MRTEMKLEDYCEECKYIEPIAESCVTQKETYVYVWCRNKEHCKWLYNRLRKEATMAFKINDNSVMYGQCCDDTNTQIDESAKTAMKNQPFNDEASKKIEELVKKATDTVLNGGSKDE